MPQRQTPVEEHLLKGVHWQYSVSGQHVISKSTLNSFGSKSEVQNDTRLIKCFHCCLHTCLLPVTSLSLCVCHVSVKLFRRLFTSSHVPRHLEGFVLQNVHRTCERTSHTNYLLKAPVIYTYIQNAQPTCKHTKNKRDVLINKMQGYFLFIYLCLGLYVF